MATTHFMLTYLLLFILCIQGDYYGDHSWQRGDERDEDAKKAYDAVLRITLKYHIDESQSGFIEEVKKRAIRDYGFDYGDEDVNIFKYNYPSYSSM